MVIIYVIEVKYSN